MEQLRRHLRTHNLQDLFREHEKKQNSMIIGSLLDPGKLDLQLTINFLKPKTSLEALNVTTHAFHEAPGMQFDILWHAVRPSLKYFGLLQHLP